jgi:F-box protein 18 (helicase)
MTYTNEQQAAIECQDNNLSVNAFSGSGKTSMLIGYAEARPKNSFLYVAFNSAVAAEARTKFPSNVECRTSHSLAFSKHGSPYKNKLGNVRARDCIDYLQPLMNRTELGHDQYQFAQLALNRVNRFLASGGNQTDISDEDEDHMPSTSSGDGNDPRSILKAARLIWLAMKDIENKGVAMPHDGYLKLFQLSNTDMSKYDIVLLDEAQDINPCVFSFVKKQPRKVLVGDRHQNIYSFRGSMNAMDRIEGTTLALTTSFRFGPEIASVANAILGTFCNEQREIIGLNTSRSKSESHCHLHRTNAGLFDKAVKLLEQKERLHFVGGVDSYQFGVISDTWKLYAGLPNIRDPFLRRFKTFSELEKYNESVEDPGLNSRLKVVELYGSKIPSCVEQLIRCDNNAENATAVLTTAHKSKGLEWDCVELGDDFPDMMVEGRPRTTLNAKQADAHPLSVEEANIIYVAATRAKKQLMPFVGLAEFMDNYNQL